MGYELQDEYDAPPVLPALSSGSGAGSARPVTEMARSMTRRGQKQQATRMDIIDQLDASALGGSSLFHHDSPYDAVSAHRNRHATRAPVLAFDGSDALAPPTPHTAPAPSVEGLHADVWGVGAEPWQDFSHSPHPAPPAAPAGHTAPPAPYAESAASSHLDLETILTGRPGAPPPIPPDHRQEPARPTRSRSVMRRFKKEDGAPPASRSTGTSAGAGAGQGTEEGSSRLSRSASLFSKFRRRKPSVSA